MGGSWGKRWGTIDLIEVYWPALTRIGYPSKFYGSWAGATSSDGPQGPLGPNYTDFATFNSLSNALVADPLRPNFALGPAYLGQLWGPTAPKWLGAAGKK